MDTTMSTNDNISNKGLLDAIHRNGEVVQQNSEAIGDLRTLVETNSKAIAEVTQAVDGQAEAIQDLKEMTATIVEQTAQNTEGIKGLDDKLDELIGGLKEELAVRNSHTFLDHENRIEQLEEATGLTG